MDESPVRLPGYLEFVRYGWMLRDVAPTAEAATELLRQETRM